MRDNVTMHVALFIWLCRWNVIQIYFFICQHCNKQQTQTVWFMAHMQSCTKSTNKFINMLSTRDRTNRLLLFRDRISNCTNLFPPEPNQTEPYTQIRASRRGPPTLQTAMSHKTEAVTAICWGHFRRQMTIVEIIIAKLHRLSNSGHRVDCSALYVRDGRGCTKWDRRDGLTKNKENA